MKILDQRYILKKKMGLAKLFRAKICLEVEKILYRFQRKRVLCAKYSWDLLVRDGSWVLTLGSDCVTCMFGKRVEQWRLSIVCMSWSLS